MEANVPQKSKTIKMGSSLCHSELSTAEHDAHVRRRVSLVLFTTHHGRKASNAFAGLSSNYIRRTSSEVADDVPHASCGSSREYSRPQGIHTSQTLSIASSNSLKSTVEGARASYVNGSLHG